MRSWLRDGWRNWLWLLAAAVLFLSALFLPLSSALAEEWTPEEKQLLQAFQKGEIIRLHVLAHSDSAYDQGVKMAVRDALLNAFGAALAVSADDGFQAACDFLIHNLSLFERVAQAKACELGFQGTVKAETGLMELPEKTYGSVTLPKGEYRALRITLGSGKGQNWWCVLFPRLCLNFAGETASPPSAKPVWHSRRIFANWLLCRP